MYPNGGAAVSGFLFFFIIQFVFLIAYGFLTRYDDQLLPKSSNGNSTQGETHHLEKSYPRKF